jgi:hypothetical protein
MMQSPHQNPTCVKFKTTAAHTGSAGPLDLLPCLRLSSPAVGLDDGVTTHLAGGPGEHARQLASLIAHQQSSLAPLLRSGILLCHLLDDTHSNRLQGGGKEEEETRQKRT